MTEPEPAQNVPVPARMAMNKLSVNSSFDIDCEAVSKFDLAVQ